MRYTINHATEGLNLIDEISIPTLLWEVLALCLAVWTVINHFRELRQSPTGLTIGDCFMVLIRSHVQYFAIVAIVSFLYIGSLSPKIMYSVSAGIASFFFGTIQLSQALQMFVLGPRLILSVRQCHAKLVSRSDEGTGMTTIAFEVLGRVSMSGGV
ncbi:hypothetical protein DFH29DRAFT_551567 [Suillus ampliporus]|nr:hypothetical protein DFH29DRAFT_551567 [Suillus ampliporus]